MSETSKSRDPWDRRARIYVRQLASVQVSHNRECNEQHQGTGHRNGEARIGRLGIFFAFDGSSLARNNVGWCRSEAERQPCFRPDEAIAAAGRTVFDPFAELGFARQSSFWFGSQTPALLMPTRMAASLGIGGDRQSPRGRGGRS